MAVISIFIVKIEDIIRTKYSNLGEKCLTIGFYSNKDNELHCRGGGGGGGRKQR